MNIKYPDYSNSIMNVTNSILQYYNIKTNYNGQSMLDDYLTNHQPKHIVYILLDGMGANIIEEHLQDTDILKQHMKTKITSVFPPTTVAATNSVLSGLPPISTGYLGWVQYFPKEDVNMVVFQNQDFYDPTRLLPKQIAQKYLKYDNIITKISQTNSHIVCNSFFPSFVEGGSISFSEEIEKTLLFIHNNDQTFSYVYWTQPDLTEHQFGIHSTETKEMLQALNTTVEELVEHLPKETVVICIADHGLTDVSEINLLEYNDITECFERLPSIEPRATNFFIKDTHHTQFKTLFNQHFNGKFKLYSKQELLNSGLFGQGQEHPMISSFIGDYFSVAIKEYMFTLSNKKIYKGHHAGLLEDEMMVPLILIQK